MNDPLVSIGVPVYNGENYLASALTSVLAQSYVNLEVVIYDNASTDRTSEICERFAAKDPRVRYVRQQRNVGASQNFNDVFHDSTGELFKWAAHDDVLEPEYIARTVEVLMSDPTVVLCHSEVAAIDESDAVTGSGEKDPAVVLTSANSDDVVERFRDLIFTPHICYDVFGVMPRRVMESTSLIASTIGSDRKLLTEIALRGRIVRVPEPLFLSRDHDERSVQALPLRDRAEWFAGTAGPRLVFPQWRELAGILQAIYHAPLSLKVRSKLMLSVGRWLRLNVVFLLRDLKGAALSMTGRR